MPRWLRITFISTGSFIVLIILLWLVLAWIIRSNKQTLLREISAQLSNRLNGQLEIRDMEPSLVHSFPNISVTLKDVSLKDSLFRQHHHALLDVKEIFVKVNTFAILRKKVEIRQISLKDGNIDLYTDSSGYSNTYLLQGHSSGGKQPVIERFRMENMQFSLENGQKNKRFRFAIRSMRGEMKNNEEGWTCALHTDMRIQDMAFNTAKGSYAQNKTLQADIDLRFTSATRTLSVPSQILYFDQQPFTFDGTFNFSQAPPVFSLKITGNHVHFREAASLLTPAISRKLDSIDFAQPLNVQADIRGHMQYRDTPYVHVTWDTKDNVLSAQSLVLGSCSFRGGFLNEVTPGNGHNDANSRLSLYDFKCRFGDIPVSADTIRIFNLKKPLLTGRFRSRFPLGSLTAVMDTGLFRFSKGGMDVDLEYQGSWDARDTMAGFLRGTMKVQDGAFVYVPRGLAFSNCQATLDFTGQDLFLRNVHVQSGNSTVQMEGSIRNILNFYFSAPEKIVLDWSVRSPLINLNEFQSFFTQRRKGAVSQRKKQQDMARAIKQLEVMLDACSMNMKVALDKVRYRQFTASNVKAGIYVTRNDVRLNNVALQTAGGQMQLNGSIAHGGVGNDRFSVDARLRQVQIDQLFHAFEDFGQNAIRGKNLKGILSATAKVSGGLKEDVSIKRHSLFGAVTFDLNKGALIHFEPLEDIGMFIFRKRDMSNITFENIHNTLDIQGNKIIIHPMMIASSVLNIQLEGIYGFSKGTNIKMKVPLRNPKKDELITDAEELKKRRKKGIVINLRAVDGPDGKVKIKLGKGD